MKLFKFLSFFSILSILTSCNIVLIEKPGSLELYKSRTLINNGEFKKAKFLLEKPIKSTSITIKGKAIYETARIENANGNYDKYIKSLEQANNLGNTQSKIKLALAYMQHNPTTENIEKAYIIFESEKDNSAQANIELAKISQDKAVQNKYIENARAIYEEKILDKGDKDGNDYLKIARLYSKYKEFPHNFNQSELWYRKAIKQGNSVAAYELGKLWIKYNLRKNSEKDAFKLILQAANTGNNKAIKHIAYAYLTGKGINKNIKEAALWYNKIPNDKVRKKSLEIIADAYMKGDGVPINTNEAFRLYEKAAQIGSVKSILMMASKTNNSEAKWSHELKAISTEDLYSTLKKLKRMYGNQYPKIINRQNYIAARNGSAEASLIIANNFENGFSITRDSKKAKIWYKKAANQGSSEAMLILARIYSLNTKLDNNLEKSFIWYKKAAEQNNNEAQYQTGLLYALGRGIKKDIVKSRYWLEKAHNNGYPLAIETLESILKENE